MLDTAGLQFRTERRGDQVVLYASGELDIASRDSVIEAVCAALEEGAATVELDLAGIRFCDSTGLSGLIAAQRIAQAEGAEAYSVGASDQVRNLLALSRMDHADADADPPAFP